jgi:hypothetical protein
MTYLDGLPVGGSIKKITLKKNKLKASYTGGEQAKPQNFPKSCLVNILLEVLQLLVTMVSSAIAGSTMVSSVIHGLMAPIMNWWSALCQLGSTVVRQLDSHRNACSQQTCLAVTIRAFTFQTYVCLTGLLLTGSTGQHMAGRNGLA